MNLLTNPLIHPISDLSQIKFTRRTARNHSGIQIKSAQEIEIMRKASRIVATVLKEISEIARPGMSTADLDLYAEKRIRQMGAIPSFKGYHGFPATICASINNEMVHGIPSSKRFICEGDLLKVDTGAFLEGYHGDSCITICIGNVTEEASRLSLVAQESLMAGLSKIKAGNNLLDIARAVQEQVESANYSAVEEYTGHGVGRNLHEQPTVFNFDNGRLPNIELEAGMTLAVEPILNTGSKAARVLSDRWTVVTMDGKLSAQWEHTVVITSDGCEILTDRNS
uniref:Methionine aminopeptidase n=1 Tax=Paulinella longichromatophora TaxID=1708747 RepID=A0A2H4ZNC2_9EUKA|nr:methionine aminopeptidase [Paulinella longichromatophora]